MDLILIVFLTLLNGLFAMSELAIAASRKARLAALQESGDAGAIAALRLMDRPTQFLSTVQVGITSIGMLNGIVGEAAFSGPVAAWLVQLGLGARSAPIVATALVVTIITFTTIVFGELVPKRIGQMFPETVARWVSRPMIWLSRMTRPFVWLLTRCTQTMLKLLRIDESRTRHVTEEEISASLEEGVDAGLIEAHEHQMVRNVFHLDNRPLTSLMVPRTEIEWLDESLNTDAALDYVAGRREKEIHSWYPVCRGSLDNVRGMISVARLLQLGRSVSQPLEAHLTPVQFVPETLSGMEMLEELRLKSGRLALVVDEYGVVQGLVTPHDFLEAITGELKPEAEIDAWARPMPDGGWILDGLMPIGELKARLEIDQLPLEDKSRYNTLAGLLMAVLGRLPTVGEKVECAGWIFAVDRLQGRRVDRIFAHLVANNQQES